MLFCCLAKCLKTNQVTKYQKTHFLYSHFIGESNTKDANQVSRIIRQLEAVPHKVLWPIIPALHNGKTTWKFPQMWNSLKPIGYLEMLQALQECKFVFTDSGGLQKEAYWARKQCFTLRDDTEWV
jgi:UDP-GlcNAc3NAcA epimerase